MAENDGGTGGDDGKGGTGGDGKGRVMSGGQGQGAAGDDKGGKGGGTAWFYADGVPGTGERPAFLDTKFKSLADQAKAYPELSKAQGKFGSYFGAPEKDYELKAPEGFEGQFNLEDPLLKEFLPLAKEMNLSQAAFDKLVGHYVGKTAGLAESVEERSARVAGELGENGAAIITDTWNRLQHSGMPADLVKGLDDALGSAPAIRAIAWLMESEVKLPANVGSGSDVVTREQAREMRYEKYPDGHAKAGKLKYGDDQEHTKKVDELYRRLNPGKDIKRVAGASA